MIDPLQVATQGLRPVKKLGLVSICIATQGFICPRAPLEPTSLLIIPSERTVALIASARDLSVIKSSPRTLDLVDIQERKVQKASEDEPRTIEIVDTEREIEIVESDRTVSIVVPGGRTVVIVEDC